MRFGLKMYYKTDSKRGFVQKARLLFGGHFGSLKGTCKGLSKSWCSSFDRTAADGSREWWAAMKGTKLLLKGAVELQSNGKCDGVPVGGACASLDEALGVMQPNGLYRVWWMPRPGTGHSIAVNLGGGGNKVFDPTFGEYTAGQAYRTCQAILSALQSHYDARNVFVYKYA